MKSTKYLIVLLLMLLTAFPLNAVTAGHVAGAPGYEMVDSNGVESPAGDHVHHASPVASHAGGMHDASDHDADECNDYCMNCLMHCMSELSSVVLIDFFALDEPLSFYLDGSRLSRAYLLYRPPIVL